MGRRGKPRPSRPRVEAPAPPRSSGRGWVRPVALGLFLAVGAGLALRLRAAHAAASIPDPTRADMLAPVRRALDGARSAVLAAPDSAAAWGAFATVLDAHHLYPEAEHAYRQARARAPAEFRWTYGLAVVRDFAGAPLAEVVAHFEHALALQPRYPPAQLRYGDALVRQGRLSEARAAYARAVELDPDFAMAHRGLGQTLLALDDLPGALVHLERAAALDPADAVVAGSLTQAYWRAGDAARAEAARAASRRKEPVYGVPDPVRYAIDRLNQTPLACDGRAREHEARAEWREALPDLELLAEMEGSDAGVRWRLGRCRKALGQRAAAATELARALALDPEHAGALAESALLAEEAGDLARAAELYRRATRRDAENGHLWKRLGGCLGPLGDLSGALEAFERAAAATPPDGELLHNWGTALARAGRHEEACERLRRALALEPDNAGAHLSLGASLALLGRRQEALQQYERAQALDPGLPVAEALRELRR